MEPYQREDRPAAEFDAYAADYEAGMDNSMKRLVGRDAESFIELKADWLLRAMRRDLPRRQPTAIRLLDYGCGVGTLLRVLRQAGFAGSLAGCDVSAGMLTEAGRRWSSGPLPELAVIEQGVAPFDSARFDIVVLSAVLHHVEPPVRHLVYADALRLLKPDGRVCIFEHNPYNPVTRWVVQRTPIDRNAQLLYPGEVKAGLAEAGASRLTTQYIMFFPPRWKLFRPVERRLHWLPCGAQYAVWATGRQAK